MVYYIEETEDRFDNIDDVIECCCSKDYFLDDDDSFRDYVRSEIGDVEIAGYTYDPIDILREMGDYDSAMSDWADGEYDSAVDNAEYELRHATIGRSIYICGYTVYAEDDVDEEDVEPEEELVESSVVSEQEKEQAAEREDRRLEDMFTCLFNN